MNKIRLMLCVVLIISSIGYADIPLSHISEDVSLSQCGINALYSSLRHLGIDISLDSLYAAIDRNSNNEVNLFQLSEFARRQKLYTKAIQRPTIDLIKESLDNNCSIIIQFSYGDERFSRSHIVSLVQSKNGEILYIDVPLKKMTLSDESLEALLKQSHGMIILSSKPFTKPFLAQIGISQKMWGALILLSLIIFIVAAVAAKQNRNKQKISSI